MVDTTFFPVGIFPGPIIEDAFVSFFRAVGQGTLDENGQHKWLLRFTILPTFHFPVCIRATSDGSNGLLSVVRSGRRVDNQEEVVQPTRLTYGDLANLESMLTSPTLWLKPAGVEAGSDGSSWLLEVVSESGYRAKCRWSPTEHRDPDFFRFGSVLLERAQLGSFRRD